MLDPAGAEGDDLSAANDHLLTKVISALQLVHIHLDGAPGLIENLLNYSLPTYTALTLQPCPTPQLVMWETQGAVGPGYLQPNSQHELEDVKSRVANGGRWGQDTCSQS